MRVFKTKRFSADAGKAGITDKVLRDAIQEITLGQASDLGGGVWKKRLNANLHRSIILAKGRNYWVYQFLFAKSDQDNITKNELAAFKQLAKLYEKLTTQQIQRLLDKNEFMEICNAKKIQE